MKSLILQKKQFSPLLLFLLMALPLSSNFPSCLISIHFPKIALLCEGSLLKEHWTFPLALCAHSRLSKKWDSTKPGDIQLTPNFLAKEKLSETSEGIEFLPEDLYSWGEKRKISGIIYVDCSRAAKTLWCHLYSHIFPKQNCTRQGILTI